MKAIRILATMMALALALVPVKAKAAEEMQFVELQAECCYKQVDYGLFERYDTAGNLISSTYVEDSLFKVNSTLTEGWGQYKQEGKVVEGTFKEANLDTKGYLRCQFTVGSTVYDACVKVKLLDWASAQKKATVKSTGNGGSTGGNGDSTGGNGDSTGGNGDSNTSGNGDSDITYPGWTDDESSDSDETYEGWVD